MDDKTFNLLEKLYGEFSDYRKETNSRFDKLENHVLRIEQDHGKKLEALFDGYRQNFEKLQEHDQRFSRIDKKLQEHDLRFDRIEQKLEKQDVEIRVIKGGK